MGQVVTTCPCYTSKVYISAGLVYNLTNYWRCDMGFRTIVLLHNDDQHNWSKDPDLGNLIATAASSPRSQDEPQRVGPGYGTVIECTHADTQRLAVLDSYSMTTLATGHWATGNLEKMRDLALLKLAAQKLGYKMVKA